MVIAHCSPEVGTGGSNVGRSPRCSAVKLGVLRGTRQASPRARWGGPPRRRGAGCARAGSARPRACDREARREPGRARACAGRWRRSRRRARATPRLRRPQPRWSVTASSAWPGTMSTGARTRAAAELERRPRPRRRRRASPPSLGLSMRGVVPGEVGDGLGLLEEPGVVGEAPVVDAGIERERAPPAPRLAGGVRRHPRRARRRAASRRARCAAEERRCPRRARLRSARSQRASKSPPSRCSQCRRRSRRASGWSSPGEQRQHLRHRAAAVHGLEERLDERDGAVVRPSRLPRSRATCAAGTNQLGERRRSRPRARRGRRTSFTRASRLPARDRRAPSTRGCHRDDQGVDRPAAELRRERRQILLGVARRHQRGVDGPRRLGVAEHGIHEMPERVHHRRLPPAHGHHAAPALAHQIARRSPGRRDRPHPRNRAERRHDLGRDAPAQLAGPAAIAAASRAATCDDGARRDAQPVIGHAPRRREHGLDHVEPAHRGRRRAGPAPLKPTGAHGPPSPAPTARKSSSSERTTLAWPKSYCG